jgi:hypothetical protein
VFAILLDLFTLLDIAIVISENGCAARNSNTWRSRRWPDGCAVPVALPCRITVAHIYIFVHEGLGIAYVAALHARVPVMLADRSSAQITKSLALMDKLLAKDVAKGKIASEAAKEARERVTVLSEEKSIQGLRDCDMVVEVSFAARENEKRADRRTQPGGV